MKQTEFNLTFQIDRKRIFEVSYYTLGRNETPYFSTGAAVFNQPKTDFTSCGQGQEYIVCGKGGEYTESKPAADFYKKWDKKHLSVLTDSEHSELMADIEKSKTVYNWVASDDFKDQRELSKMALKNSNDLPGTDIFESIGGRVVSSRINADGASVYIVRLWNNETKNFILQKYTMGAGHNGRKPELFEVLGSMIQDAHAWDNAGGIVKNFADEFGYTNEREATRIFDECERVAVKLDTLGIDWRNIND